MLLPDCQLDGPGPGGMVRSSSVFATLLIAVLGCTFSLAADVRFHRQYVEGSHGQVHVLSSRPAHDSGLQTPMLCLAPNPMTGRYFRLFMEELGRDRVMIAPDYPGLGQSDPPPGALDVAGYADMSARAWISAAERTGPRRERAAPLPVAPGSPEL